MNTLLILLMLFVSNINTYENLNLENSELYQQMKNNAISLNDNGESELNKFYEQENHKYYNDIHYAPSSISNKEKIKEINFLEKKQKQKQKPQKKKIATKKTKKPKQKPGKFQDSFKHIVNKSKKPAKKYPQAKIISQHNPYFPKKKATIARETKSSYCKHKNGFLYLVKSPKSLGVAPLSIKTVPVYVSLTMSSVKVQMGLSFKTLFETIRVKNILRITKKFKNAYCFEIVEDKIMEKTLAKLPIVLCASTSKSLLEWVKALQEFKDCMYNNNFSNGYNTQTLMDFKLVNRLIKTPKQKSAAKGFDPMYYNNGPPLKKKKPEYVMKRQLAGIVGLLERGRINKQKIKRKMKDKLHKAKRIEYDIRMKKDAINKIMDHRRNKEKEGENKFRSHMQKKKRSAIIKGC